MYGRAFSEIYDEYGWNVYAELFAERLLRWIGTGHVPVGTAVDLGCGTGVLCRALADTGIRVTGRRSLPVHDRSGACRGGVRPLRGGRHGLLPAGGTLRSCDLHR